MGWDAERGRTRILVYLHAGGPGAQWARGLREGDDCVVFGPRRSVRLAGPRPAVIVFGDETSFGLAAALADQTDAPAVLGLFEVSRPGDSAAVIERLDMQGATLHARRENDGHFTELEARMVSLLREHPEADVVLTGRAGAIQRIGKLLKREDLAIGRRQGKAYWAPGKTGLD
jgi:NADPH-dependent ferric siderophore reductase